MIGRKFGKWTVIDVAGIHPSSRDKLWLCKCDCGREGKVKTYYLTKKYSEQCKYCGCHTKKPYPLNSIPHVIWKRIIRNASKRNIAFNLDSDNAYKLLLKQRFQCALSGLPIQFPKHGTDYLNNVGTASLDRINSDLGYTKNNIQWVHKDINLMKNALSLDKFKKLCKLVSNYEI